MSLTGLPVFAIDAGKNLGTVERLLFSPEEKRLTALVLTPDASGSQPMLAIERIRSIGHDAITVESGDDLEATAEGELPAGVVAFDQIEKERVLTESGEDLGTVSSLHFDETGFRLVSLELGRGFLSSSFRVSVHDIISVGEDVIVVRDTAITGGEAPAGALEMNEERECRERREPGSA
jgi:uncharacterized protein YrrD